MDSYRLLEHTADIGIEAHADTRSGLFLAAARGLRQVLSSQSQQETEQELTVQIEGEDDGELMVNWLNEILFLFEARSFFPVAFFIERLEEKSLTARLTGARFDPSRHRIDREVKAATYHQLRVASEDGSWVARIYIDL